MKLYRWQEECLRAWEDQGYRGIAHVVTGAGKTVLALSAMDAFLKKHPDGCVRIVVPTIPLAQQWETAITHHMRDAARRPGFFWGSSRDDSLTPILIYVINSAREALSRHVRRSFSLGQHVLLICDECHHYQSPQNRRIFDFVDSSYARTPQYACLGLSATPFGGGEDEVLIHGLGPVIYRYDFQAASRDGIISPFCVCETAVSFLPAEKDRYDELSREIFLCLQKIWKAHPDWKALSPAAFRKAVARVARAAKMDPANPCAAYLLKSFERKAVVNLAESRLRCCLSLVKRLPETSRILIFCERIEQAEEMVRLLRFNHAGRCALYHSKMAREARIRNMTEFREGAARILVSCRCLDEGVDVPDANIGIVLSGASVSRQRIQRMGRILRRAEGKAAACLYYLYIRESTEDAAFLPGLLQSQTRGLRYLSQENAFSSELYEYASQQVLSEGQKAAFTPGELKELRRCLLEGLPRTDYLLSTQALRQLRHTAATRHEKNYWLAMEKLHRVFTEGKRGEE